MKIRHVNFKEHIFFFILASLIIAIGLVSYYRFMVKHDYMVGYEGACDPVIEKCFMGYDGDEQYFYSDLYRECGKDITDCEAASVCLKNDRKCSITYCDKEIDGDVCKISVENIDNIQSNN